MRTFDAHIPNKIANHPDVVRKLEWVPEDHPETGGWLLFGAQVEDPDHYVFLVDPTERLCMIFEWNMPGAWQMHVMSMPDFRGRDVIRAGRLLIHEMLTVYDAESLWAQPPVKNRPATMYARIMGGRSVGFGHHFVAGDVQYFKIDRDKWLADYA